MIFVVFAVLAVSAGVVLAALDGAHVRNQQRLERVTALLVAAVAAAAAVGILQAVFFD